MVYDTNERSPSQGEHDDDYRLFLEEIRRLESPFKRQVIKNTPSTTYRPFEHLREKIRKNQNDIKATKEPVKIAISDKGDVSPNEEGRNISKSIHKSDYELFLSEVGEVRKIAGPERILNRPEKKALEKYHSVTFELEIRNLNDYSRIYQNAFSLEYSAEYVEWIASDVDKSLVKRLHRGEFSVQEYLDLHGYFLGEALEACNNFLTRALNENKRCIAIIHGRGLSSSNGPVLKDAVVRWLKKGPFRRHILCFVTAPQNDGGFGVTYILLRKNRAR